MKGEHRKRAKREGKRRTSLRGIEHRMSECRQQAQGPTTESYKIHCLQEEWKENEENIGTVQVTAVRRKYMTENLTLVLYGRETSDSDNRLNRGTVLRQQKYNGMVSH